MQNVHPWIIDRIAARLEEMVRGGAETPMSELNTEPVVLRARTKVRRRRDRCCERWRQSLRCTRLNTFRWQRSHLSRSRLLRDRLRRRRRRRRRLFLFLSLSLSPSNHDLSPSLALFLARALPLLQYDEFNSKAEFDRISEQLADLLANKSAVPHTDLDEKRKGLSPYQIYKERDERDCLSVEIDKMQRAVELAEVVREVVGQEMRSILLTLGFAADGQSAGTNGGRDGGSGRGGGGAEAHRAQAASPSRRKRAATHIKAVTAEGHAYYTDAVTQETSWVHPGEHAIIE